MPIPSDRERTPEKLPPLVASLDLARKHLAIADATILSVRRDLMDPDPVPPAPVGALHLAYGDLERRMSANVIPAALVPWAMRRGARPNLWLYAGTLLKPPGQSAVPIVLKDDVEAIIDDLLDDGLSNDFVCLDIEAHAGRILHGWPIRAEGDRVPTIAEGQQVAEVFSDIEQLLRDRGVLRIGHYAFPGVDWREEEEAGVERLLACGFGYETHRVWCPSIYDWASEDQGDTANQEEAHRNRIRMRIRMAMTLAEQDADLVAPTIWHRYHHWQKRTRHLLSDEEFIRDQVTLPRDEFGITQFILWGKPTRVIEQGTTDAFSETVMPSRYPLALDWLGEDRRMTADEVEAWLGDVLPRHLITLLLSEIRNQ